MSTAKTVDSAALVALKTNRQHLTAQQYCTLRGQVLAGNPTGALKGLNKILTTRSNSKEAHA